MKLKFNKEESGNWFIDLPEWTGSKAELQMVLGADTMLDILAKGENTVTLEVSTEHFEGAKVLAWFGEGVAGDPSFGGGMYRTHLTLQLADEKPVEKDLDMWLCDVTKFVFGGYMPDLIFFRVAE